MTKRKRASLKDQDPEALGLTQKKGKGMDLLFGRPLTVESGAMDNADDSENEADEAVAAEVDNMAANNRAVDELGLPVALEEPPDDLIPASAPAATISAAGETDAVDPALSPFALPVFETGAVAENQNDLSGIQAEENLPIGEDETLANSTDPNDLSGIIGGSTLSGVPGSQDLSGIVEDSGDLSGLVAAPAPGTTAAPPPATAVNTLAEADEDLSGLVTDINLPSVPPTTAAPINVSVPSVTPMFQPSFAPPVTSVGGSFVTSTPPLGLPSTPVPTIAPPSTATGAPNLSPPRTTIDFQGVDPRVAGVISTLGESLPNTREAYLPKDELPDQKQALAVLERAQIERDEAITKQVLDYIGPERRNSLFEEIQSLHERVAKDLSNNSTDVQFALNTLLEANDIIIEDPRQYDEALYRVSLVKAMLFRRNKLTYWSYRAGLLVLFYGLFWTVAAVSGILYPFISGTNFEVIAGESELTPIFLAVWFSALAGALGGAVEVLWRLYYRVSVKQDFDPQYLMYYLVKPILGFVLGMVMYFVVAAVASLGVSTTLPIPSTTTGFVFSLLLGFVAGYRQETVFDMIYVLFKKLGPKTDSGGQKSMVIPANTNPNPDSSGSSS